MLKSAYTASNSFHSAVSEAVTITGPTDLLSDTKADANDTNNNRTGFSLTSGIRTSKAIHGAKTSRESFFQLSIKHPRFLYHTGNWGVCFVFLTVRGLRRKPHNNNNSFLC